jgi:integrase
MVRRLGRLKALTVARLKAPGLYPDGGGLYLQISGAGGRSWTFRYMLRGRAREMGLGSLANVPLAEARGQAELCRRQRAAGIDPIEAREAERARLQLEAANAVTFSACAEAYIAAHEPGWRNAKHAAQWRTTLATYAAPVFGAMPVQAVALPQIMRALEPIWTAKPETASRLRGRIEAVLDWATTRGYRQGDNPARWRGHLENLLPKRSKVQPVEHHRALPYGEIGEFMAALRAEKGVAAGALEFTILTAARTAEAIGARWSEIDLAEKLWTIAPERIKARREHRVPLSAPVLTILEKMAAARDGDYVFPGARSGKPLSNMAMLKVLARMRRDVLTVHGFRSSFRDWAAERTNYPREVAEAALAHVVSDKVEAAYRRGDLFEKRRRLMEEWARYCGSKPAERGKVVSLGRAEA